MGLMASKDEVDFPRYRSKWTGFNFLCFVFGIILLLIMTPMLQPPSSFAKETTFAGFKNSKTRVDMEAGEAFTPHLLSFDAGVWRTWCLFIGVYFITWGREAMCQQMDETIGGEEDRVWKFAGKWAIHAAPWAMLLGYIFFAFGVLMDNDAKIPGGERNVTLFLLFLLGLPISDWLYSKADQAKMGTEQGVFDAYRPANIFCYVIHIATGVLLGYDASDNFAEGNIKLNGICMLFAFVGFLFLRQGGWQSVMDSKNFMKGANGGEKNNSYSAFGGGNHAYAFGWFLIFLAAVLGETGKTMEMTGTFDVSFAFPISGRTFFCMWSLIMIVIFENVRRYAHESRADNGGNSAIKAVFFGDWMREDTPVLCSFFESPYPVFFSWLVLAFSVTLHPLTGDVLDNNTRNVVVFIVLVFQGFFREFIYFGLYKRSMEPSKMMGLVFALVSLLLNLAAFIIISFDLDITQQKDDGMALVFGILGAVNLFFADIRADMADRQNDGKDHGCTGHKSGVAFGHYANIQVLAYVFFFVAISNEMDTTKNGYYGEDYITGGSKALNGYPWYSNYPEAKFTDFAGYGPLQPNGNNVDTSTKVDNEFS